MFVLRSQNNTSDLPEGYKFLIFKEFIVKLSSLPLLFLRPSCMQVSDDFKVSSIFRPSEYLGRPTTTSDLGREIDISNGNHFDRSSNKQR